MQGCSTQSTAPLRTPLTGNLGLGSLGGCLTQSLCWAGPGLTWGRKAAKVEVFKRNSMSFGICGRRTVTARHCSVALGQDQPLLHLSPCPVPRAAPRGSVEETVVQRSPVSLPAADLTPPPLLTMVSVISKMSAPAVW